MSLTVTLAAFFSYALMLVAYFLPRHRLFHIPVMVSVIAFDVGAPIYLYLHRNWWHRLIEKQEVFSSLVWMHFALFITLYALEGAQVYTATKLLKGDTSARESHHAQGRILLFVRALVIVSGGILSEPD